MKINHFPFIISNHLIPENGALLDLGAIFQKDGFNNPQFFIDEGFASSDYWKQVSKNLEPYLENISTIIVSGKSEPTYEDLRNYLEKSKSSDPDLIVGIGGGSCMDTAKAVGALLKNPGDPIIYRGFDKLSQPGIPVYLAPTTAGTGSEASYNASFVNSEDNKKMGINGKFMFPQKSILDGFATISCPFKPSVGACVDAIVHSLEGFICKQSNYISDMYATSALKILLENAYNLLDKKPCEISRLNLLIGAYLGGIVQMNSGSGIAAAISYPLSVYYKVPHGIGGGIFLNGVIEFNIKSGYKKYNELDFISKDGNFVKELQELFDSLDVPKDLLEFGISKDNHEHLCEVMKTQQAAFDQNPIKFSVENDFPNFISEYLQ